MTNPDWREILKLFEAPGHQGVYVLGCFARYVTLYSQQVRALNLIAGLQSVGKLAKGTKVAVVGGGAAGMTAAAGAALLGAHVLILEELQGGLELQRNNRQRWIHPHIYDWPDMEFHSDDARLPVLTWTAGYAESVARQIEDGFDALKRSANIEVIYSAHDIKIIADPDPGTRDTELWWSAPVRGGEDRFPVIILAPGFGLEPKTDVQDSYWAEDDIDGGFRTTLSGQKWLVSGLGDGAYTDLIRLCIRRFRHAEIKDLFASERGYLGVIDDLREIHRDPTISNQKLSDKFKELSVKHLSDTLRSRLRNDGLKVVLNGRSSDLYGRNASILNRLIVLLLSPKHLDRFTFTPGRYAGAEISKHNKDGRKYLVTFGTGIEAYQSTFDRVILRHGPEPKLSQDFQVIARSCELLSGTWKALGYQGDLTRKRLWDQNTFPHQTFAQAIDTSEVAFAEAVRRLGVRASAFTVRKELRGNGSSTVGFEFDQLSVEHGGLRGIRIAFESSAGMIGRPQLDPVSVRRGFTWIDHYRVPEGLMDSVSMVRDRARKIDIIVSFPDRLTPFDSPISFQIGWEILNGDATSTWELDQMYAPEEKVYFSQKQFIAPLEYITRCVWFPVENLRMRLTLPDSVQQQPDVRVFASPDSGELAVEEVVIEELLQLHPSPTSKWKSWRATWTDDPTESVRNAGRLFPISPTTTWELAVYKPQVSHCYSLEWFVNKSISDSTSTKLDKAAEALREDLMEYGQLTKHSPETPRIRKARQVFKGLYETMRERYATDDRSEGFVLTLMTYNSSERQLIMTDAILNYSSPPDRTWNFRLPYGVGLGGACFKLGKTLLYVKARADKSSESTPSYYVPATPNEYHEVLLSFPLGVPHAACPTDYEFGRQCVAILSIGSSSPQSKLRVLEDSEKLSVLAGECQEAFNLLVKYLRPES